MCKNTPTCILFVRRRPSAAQRTHHVCNPASRTRRLIRCHRVSSTCAPRGSGDSACERPYPFRHWVLLNQECVYVDNHACRRIMLSSAFMISWTIFLRLRIWKNINVKEMPGRNSPWKDHQTNFPQGHRSLRTLIPRFFLLQEETQPAVWLMRMEGRKDPMKGSVWSVKPRKLKVRLWRPEREAT